MAKTDLSLKQIGDLLDRKLKPVNKRLDSADQSVSSRLNTIEEQLKHQGYTLQGHTESLVFIEDKVKVLPDLLTLAVEHSNTLKDHEERITGLESSGS